MPPVTKNLIISNVIIWLAMMLIPGEFADNVVKYCGLHYLNAIDFNPAQLFTYMFIHSTSGIAHLFFNMFTLFMFGITLERVMGPRKFLFYYISCGLGAALIQEGVWALMVDSFVDNRIQMIIAEYASHSNLTMQQALSSISQSQIQHLSATIENALVTVGASGAIYGVLLAFGMLFPNMPLFLMFIPVPIKAKWMVLGYGAIEIALGLSSANDGVAHFAHLGGMIFGFLIILYWKHKGLFRGNGGYY
ncbi:MAG: rhomboid family intramembrane serine protease [Muribaculum sp.]|nr:rhomboid family intramembrane serine protease [Muribaculaceae bacterium]MCM1081419.1 rhomboid family intramembrane serine protease [Muribaculum sp.]